MTGGPALPAGVAEDQPPDWTQYLSVDADLTIAVDTASGEHATGRLTSEGHRLRLTFDRPEILRGAAGRSTVDAVATQLVGAHLNAELYGPHGRIAAIVPGRTSRVAAVLTGSPHVVLDRAAWTLAARTAAPAAAGVAAGVAALLGVTALVHRRRMKDVLRRR